MQTVNKKRFWNFTEGLPRTSLSKISKQAQNWFVWKYHTDLCEQFFSKMIF